MSLLGTGAVAIWHDISPQGRDEFYAWHGEEHMPERVGVPGFLRSSRYVAVEGSPEFFILHEAATFAVLASPDYQASLNHPTPRTLAISPHFRNAARSLCHVATSFGHARAGLIATLRYDITTAAEKHREAMTNEIIPALQRSPVVSAAHFLIADPDASALETAERRARSGNDAAPGWVLLVESWGDSGTLQSFCDEELSLSMRKQAGAGGSKHGLYRLQATLSQSGAS